MLSSQIIVIPFTGVFNKLLFWPNTKLMSLLTSKGNKGNFSILIRIKINNCLWT